MSRFSAKVRIVYLTLVILFTGGVFLYLLDTWGVIRLEEKLPFLASDPPRTPLSEDSQTLLEKEALEKQEEKLKEKELELQEMQERLQTRQEALQQEQQKLDEAREGLKEARKQLERESEARQTRDEKIQQMAQRLGAMPPDDAVAIVRGWSNVDVVDVFVQMERNAEEAGEQSIVPFLITKLPRERASLITTLMMDAVAERMPAPESSTEPTSP
ncbi:MAG TPA: hypothetical protein DEA96_10040 [Leptospiraceae bacterium]|nr:hypothetical protein [Spirochaetaceae bacterium]HBS05296.1 hypothetical protein [Leptospiraceae bacterium]|tara:strand:- start:452 stop:1096 length:645 start_codon:yes stop_codon:yes gene_type:complete